MTDDTPTSPFAGLDPDDYVLTFATVASRKRYAGWTADRQRRFILLLRECGVVSMAASAAGCSPQSAYKLRSHPSAIEFAAAWDRALDEARDRAFDLALRRAREGYTTPIFYRGRCLGTMQRYDNRLALAALNCADRQVAAKGER